MNFLSPKPGIANKTCSTLPGNQPYQVQSLSRNKPLHSNPNNATAHPALGSNILPFAFIKSRQIRTPKLAINRAAILAFHDSNISAIECQPRSPSRSVSPSSASRICPSSSYDSFKVRALNTNIPRYDIPISLMAMTF